eukprot:scaffold5558_cov162-Amphora_coffeaeformis.AAC.3
MTTKYHESDSPTKDRKGAYSRGRTLSRTTYIHRTNSSVSVASDRKQRSTEIKTQETDQAGNVVNDESLSHLRSTINSERNSLIERVSSLIPTPSKNDDNIEWERAMKSVLNDSGVLLFQPTINLYGSGRVPHGLEPEGVNTSRHSSSGPEIVNLTEAEEEMKNKSKAEKNEIGTDLSCDGSDRRVVRETSSVTAPGQSGEKVEHPLAEPIHVIDCTNEMYDRPGLFQQDGLLSQSRVQEERRRTSHPAGNRNTQSTGLRGSLSNAKLSMQLSGKSVAHHSERGNYPGQAARVQHSPPHMSEDSVDSIDSQPLHEKKQISGPEDCLDARDRCLSSCPPCGRDAMGKVEDLCFRAGHGISKAFHRNDIDSRPAHERKRLPGRKNRRGALDQHPHSCPPCERSDAMGKMEDLCLRAGQGIGETFRRSLPKRNTTSTGLPQSVIRDDDDDGMEAELRDLEVSEQLLRKELELVHKQAEIRRQRLRRNDRNDVLPPMDIFSECLWPSNREERSSKHMLGRGLVAQSFSTSHKSIDDDLTDNYFSPTEDDSTGIYLSPQTSLEQIRVPELRGEIGRQKAKSEHGTKLDRNEEMEVIFVEESFMSTDSFSFGEVTKKSVCLSPLPEKKTKSENDSFSYLRQAASHSVSSGPDPIGEIRSGSQRIKVNQQPGRTAEPVEIISLLSMDRSSSKSEDAEQPGDPSMPISVGSEDFVSLESPSSSRDRCDPSGTSVELRSQGSTHFPPKPQDEETHKRRPEKNSVDLHLRTKQEQYLNANDSVDLEPLESIEIVALENGRIRKNTAADTFRVVTPQTFSQKSVHQDSINGKNDNQCTKGNTVVRHSRNTPRSSNNNRHERHRLTVTFLLPKNGVEVAEDGKSRVSSDCLSKPGDTKSQHFDVIDLRDFDESALGSHSTASSSGQSDQQLVSSSTRESSRDSSSRVSALLEMTESSESELAFNPFSSDLDETYRSATGNSNVGSLYSGSHGSTPSARTSSHSKDSSGGATGNESSSCYTRSGSQQSGSLNDGPKRLETIESVQDENRVTYLSVRPELPPPNGTHDSSYGASTFEDDTCESLSSRVKKLIAKAKANNKREAGHDTFESRSTLTIKIPESLSITEDDEPEPAIHRNIPGEDADLDEAIDDIISPEFVGANRIPARVMLAQPGSQDQGSLSTVTLPLQFKESRTRQCNRSKKTRAKKAKSSKYPDLMAIADGPYSRNKNKDKGGMTIHISEPDDDSSVTWEFPETLLAGETPLKQRSKSPSRIQRLIDTGKRFVSTKRKSPRNKEGIEGQHQSTGELEKALQDTWSIEAQLTNESHNTGSDSVNFTYSLSPNESVRRDGTNQFTPSESSLKATNTTSHPDDITGRKLFSKRLDRVRKLNRSFFPQQKSPRDLREDEKPKVVTDPTPAQTSPSNSAFEDRFEAMRQRVQEMRGIGQSTSTEIFRDASPTAEQGSKHKSLGNSLRPPSPRPPRPPRREQES